MVYDLVVVGNGVAAQTFLLELFRQLELDVKKSQNYSVAQIYSEEMTPACSLRSTATVSLSGIEEGVSALGNDLRNAYYSFVEFVGRYNPSGVEAVKQLITFSNNEEKEKLIRRYKSLTIINHSTLRMEGQGIELDSYIISPEKYLDWFALKLKSKNITHKKNFLKGILKNEEGGIDSILLNGEIIKSKKVVFCTGAYSQIFAQFNEATQSISKTQVLSGSYLEKTIDLNKPSFLLTINGHNLIYRNDDKKILMGSASRKGPFFVPDFQELKNVLTLFCEMLNIPLGQFSDYKKIVGLRHKAQKRMPVVKALDENKSIYLISGFYKNGFSFSHLFAKKIVADILNP